MLHVHARKVPHNMQDRQRDRVKANLRIPSYTDALPSKCQMAQLLSLRWRGSIAAQVLQQLPAGYAVAMHKAVTGALGLALQMGSNERGECRQGQGSLIMGVVCQDKTVMLCAHAHWWHTSLAAVGLLCCSSSWTKI